MDSQCSQPASMQFLNSGFFMGPAKDLLSMLQSIRHFAVDQEGAAQFMFDHPNECTLDYSGDMVLNLHNFRAPTDLEKPLNDPGLVIHGEESPSGQHTIRNRITGRTACFLHGNGNGKATVASVARAIVAASEAAMQ
eukprot:gnl/TRDRNA2_/TRDRNA2_135369_c0_seq1.p2 gnl/TRDRNA2_/TRDRNA2_135369_c0~~gnl/TRDRNA2_/TRDRNA2_135369_c0_seq1.p2  ORF type:complete len:137 (-),score=18.23 gnl/TRDRNA2_/TRDRNA2_135369_c0_seq1:40-450(-)